MDYSKWDRFVAEVSDSDDEDQSRRPIVTRLDDSTTVSIGSDGWKSEARVQAKTTITASTAEPMTFVKNTKTKTRTRNGGVDNSFLWGQSKTECVLYVRIPETSTKISVTIEGDRLLIRASTGVILDRRLAFDVAFQRIGAKRIVPPEDIDWEVLRDAPSDAVSGDESRLLKLTLRKDTSRFGGSGVIHWWPRVFTGQKDVDVTCFPDRSANRGKPTFATAWKEAHDAFRRRRMQ